jgi:hypothetical protein
MVETGFSTVQCIGLAVMPEDDEYFCPDCKTGSSIFLFCIAECRSFEQSITYPQKLKLHYAQILFYGILD